MALTDEDGDIVNTYDYDVFGAERASTGAQENTFTFAGEQVDEGTGLQYLRARYYDPEVGSFSSRDPILEGIANRAFPYSYADANPVNLTDPTGWEPSEPVPVPLPPPGSHDDSQCIAGYGICTDRKSWNRKELDRLYPKVPQSAKDDECFYEMRKCQNRVYEGKDGYFDWDAVRSGVGARSRGWSFFRPPGTGSGGLLPPTTKEGG